MIRIIGAGFSGLSLAYFFVKKGVPVTIIEKRPRTGGVIQSEFKNNMLIESAANGFLASEKIEEMFSDIGLPILTTNMESRKKYIYRNGARRWPLAIGETIELIFRGIWAIVSDTKAPRKGETLNTWARRVLGTAGNDYLIQPMVNGIFAQDTSKLSAKLVLGSMFFKKRRRRLRGLVSARGGMGEVILKLELYLKQHKVQFEFGSDEKKLPDNSKHNTFLAMDLPSATLHFANSNIKESVANKNGLTSLSLARVTMTYRNNVNQIDGFGVLFPNKEKFFSLGVLANTKIFENRGEYNESWILGESILPDLMTLSDQQIIDKIMSDRKRLFNDDKAEVKDVSIHRWPNVVPSYDFSLEGFLDSNPEIISHLTGNYLGVLGLTGIHERNHQLVESYLERNKK